MAGSCSFVSATNLIKEVPAENNDPTITPASTIARFERIRLSRPTRYVSPTAARPKRNEPAVMTA